MTIPAYYNEIEPYAAQWLRNLIAADLIAAGDVDTRSIADVSPDDLRRYGQCHFFAGIGGWAYAARLAGWPDDRQLWTGSCPCQPFSVAGSQRGTDDERHLWPHQFRLIRACRPAFWLGEQVAAAVGAHWLDGVLSDLESIDFTGRAVVIPACAVNGAHRRDRIWVLADRDGALDNGIGARLEGHAGNDGAAAGWPEQDRPTAATCRGSMLADTDSIGGQVHQDTRGREDGSRAREVAGSLGARDGALVHAGGADGERRSAGLLAPEKGISGAHRAIDGDLSIGPKHAGESSTRADAAWIIGHDGKARRVEPSIRLLAHGVPARVGKLRAYGNAIVPQVAAEVIGALMECRP